MLFEVRLTGEVVILSGGTTVTGDVNIGGTATGSGAKLPQQVCGAIVNGNLAIQNDGDAITVGGTSCGATAVGGELHGAVRFGAVSITSTNVSGNRTVQGNTSTVLPSGNTVGKNLQVQTTPMQQRIPHKC